MSDQKNILATIPKGQTEQVQIAINEFKGKKYLDLRIFYTTDDGGTWLPSKKGVTVAPDQLPILIDAVQTAMSELGITPEA